MRRTLNKIAFVAFMAALPILAQAGPLAARIDALFTESAATKRTNMSLKVADVESGKVLYDRAGDVLFTPASNLKIYTSSAVLDEFGSAHRFQTLIGFEGFMREHRLGGNLVIKGGGDPMFSSDDLRSLARRVRTDLGIAEIGGDIVVDVSLFGLPLKGPGWMWDDDPDGYNMSIAAMMMDFNVMTVQIAPAATKGAGSLIVPPPVVSLAPAAEFPRLRVDIAAGTETNVTVTRKPFTEDILVTGTWAGADAATTQTLTMHDPAPWIGAVFIEMLREEGVAVEGGVRVSREPVSVTPLLAHDSRPLGEAIRRFNKVSENAIGEMLLHDLGVVRSKVPSTWPAGATIISEWLVDRAGLEKGSFRLVDGSGLSRYNLISADSSIRLLRYMWKHREKQSFFDSLPVYTVTLSDGKQEQRVHAKPGGMAAVSTISGYIQRTDGRWLVYSFLANGYIGTPADVRALREKVYTALAESTD